jgi:hypothetical protein
MGVSKKYSFCESVTASFVGPWHIREVGPEGLKFGGGAKAPLCFLYDADKQWLGGWDLDIEFEIEEAPDIHICYYCLALYKQRREP